MDYFAITLFNSKAVTYCQLYSLAMPLLCICMYACTGVHALVSYNISIVLPLNAMNAGDAMHDCCFINLPMTL